MELGIPSTDNYRSSRDDKALLKLVILKAPHEYVARMIASRRFTFKEFVEIVERVSRRSHDERSQILDKFDEIQRDNQKRKQLGLSGQDNSLWLLARYVGMIELAGRLKAT